MDTVSLGCNEAFFNCNLDVGAKGNVMYSNYINGLSFSEFGGHIGEIPINRSSNMNSVEQVNSQ